MMLCRKPEPHGYSYLQEDGSWGALATAKLLPASDGHWPGEPVSLVSELKRDAHEVGDSGGG